MCQITCGDRSGDINDLLQLSICAQSGHRSASNKRHYTCNWSPLASIAGNLTDQCRRGNVTREWYAAPRYRFLYFESLFDELTSTFQDFSWRVEGETGPCNAKYVILTSHVSGGFMGGA